MRRISLILLFICSHFITTLAFADTSWASENAKLGTKLTDDAVFKKETITNTIWTGSAELGLVATTGNTDTQSLNFGFNLMRETQNWRQNAKAHFLRSEENDKKTANTWLAELQIDRKLTERNYLFGNLNHQEDEFSGYDYQSTIAVGYGRKLIDSPKFKLKGEIGVGSRRVELLTGEKNTEGIVSLAGVFNWQLTETTLFQQGLTSRIGQDLTTINSLSSLTVTMSDMLALKLSIDVKHNTKVPEGKDKTDTATTAALVVSF